MKIHPIMFLMLLYGCVLSKGFAEEAGRNIAAISDSLNAPLADSEFDRHGYYTFRPDLRKCIAPLCGGIFVKAVNRKLTRCADGSLQAECYVATVNNRKNIDTSSAALLHGRIKAKIYEGFGNLGVFELKTAFSAATPAVGEGRFVGLENNGIVCITAPCFSVDQYLLNKNKFRGISGIDLAAVGATEENLNKALTLIADGGTLIASGVNKQVEEVAGTGITFVASQYYLPIDPGVQ
ncbi:MAG: hypothetical protein EPN89_17275 [Methylovulum sp.]|nr:MAG: hypothetical protein EPN89_17275 [Methylovulum sp.]